MYSLLRRRPTVWIGQGCLGSIVELASEAAPDETGGVLLGYWRADGETAVVTEVLGPGPGASQSRNEFAPDSEFHVAEVCRAYLASGRVVTYLGDWHSHPESSTFLSPLDRRTLRRIARDPAARAPQPLMAIIAGGEPWTLKIWAYYGKLRQLPRLRSPVTAELRTYGNEDHSSEGPRVSTAPGVAGAEVQ